MERVVRKEKGVKQPSKCLGKKFKILYNWKVIFVPVINRQQEQIRAHRFPLIGVKKDEISKLPGLSKCYAEDPAL